MHLLWYDRKTSLFSSTFGNIDGGLIFVGGETESPAGLFGSALLLAVFEGRDAVLIILTGPPLVRTLLFDAFLRVSQSNGFGFLSF